MLRFAGVSVLVAVFGIGCAPSDEDACNELIDALANKLQRCNLGTEQELRDSLQKTYGSCSNVKDIRDKDALYDECIPSLDGMSCSDVAGGRYDASCRNQLLF